MQEAIEILRLFKQDEKQAMKLLFETYYDKLVLYSCCVLQDKEAAEDVVQDCFVYLWKSRRLQGFVGDLEPFIFKMVKNQALSALKSAEKYQSLRATLEVAADEGDVVESEEQRKIDLLYATIEKLPPKCQQVFLMACLHNKKYQEIADELGISINTVKWHMKFAIRFLRTNLEDKLFSSILVLLTNK